MLLFNPVEIAAVECLPAVKADAFSNGHLLFCPVILSACNFCRHCGLLEIIPAFYFCLLREC